MMFGRVKKSTRAEWYEWNLSLHQFAVVMFPSGCRAAAVTAAVNSPRWRTHRAINRFRNSSAGYYAAAMLHKWSISWLLLWIGWIRFTKANINGLTPDMIILFDNNVFTQHLDSLRFRRIEHKSSISIRSHSRSYGIWRTQSLMDSRRKPVKTDEQKVQHSSHGTLLSGRKNRREIGSVPKPKWIIKLQKH